MTLGLEIEAVREDSEGVDSREFLDVHIGVIRVQSGRSFPLHTGFTVCSDTFSAPLVARHEEVCHGNDLERIQGSQEKGKEGQEES